MKRKHTLNLCNNRPSISPLQQQKIYTDFELQGVMEEKLNTKTYQTISQRMATEEAACALMEGSRRAAGDDE